MATPPIRQPTEPSTTTIRISETFGPTIQGEGPATGQRAVFARLAGCPVGCLWCDTRYSWDPTHQNPYTAPRTVQVTELVDDLIARSNAHDLVVVTGGEPLTQPQALTELVTRLSPIRPRLHLETAGMPKVPPGLLDRFELVVVSPKLSHAGPQAHRHMRISDYRPFAAIKHSWFKFVVQQPSDLDEIVAYESVLGPLRILVMPEGTDQETLRATTAAIADDVIAHGWGLSPRLHIEIWGNAPGR